MYSDDEKDFLENLNEAPDDSVPWDVILDTDENGIVSIKNDSQSSNEVSNLKTEVFSNDTDSSELNSINELISDVDIDDESSGDTEVDEDELKRILSEDSSSEIDYGNEQDDLNITADSINQNVIADQDAEDFIPRKEEVKKQTVSPVLIAALFALLVAAGVYLFFNFRSQEDDSMLPQNRSVQNTDIINNENNINTEADNSAIPVVNEEEVDKVKPDEETDAKEEKKEIVNVIPTGRINPFMPIGKYMNAPSQVKTINNIDYDSINIPKPPKKYGEISEYTEKLMTITVSGIMYDKVKPSAIITYKDEDYFVQIGDKLDIFKVVGITPDHVLVALGKNVYKAKLGEELKISEFYGNLGNANGARQYYSSEDEYTNSVEGKKPYTSGSDIQIYTK